MRNSASKPWTIEMLATDAGMSRSVFAKVFNELIGMPPKQYLRRWRMHLAREALQKGKLSVGSIATELGYESEAAFRNAFRADTGQSPRQFRIATSTLPAEHRPDQLV